MFVSNGRMPEPGFDDNFGFSIGGTIGSVTKKFTSGASSLLKKGAGIAKWGIKAQLAPMKFVEDQTKKVLPKEISKHLITPSTYATKIADKPEKFAREALGKVKEVTYRPTYELTKKVFGPKAAGLVMPRWVNPEDVNIKPGTEAAANFRGMQAVGEQITMGVAGTVVPPVGLAYGVYTAAKTVDEVEDAKALMNERIAQEEAQAALMARKQKARLRGDKRELNKIRKELNALNAGIKQTDGKIDKMARDNPDMEAPSEKNEKAALAVGGAALTALAIL